MQTHILEEFLPHELTNIVDYFKIRAESKDVIKRWTNIMIIKSASLRFVVDTILNTFDSYGEAYLLLINYNNHVALTGERGAPIIELSNDLLIHIKNVLNYNYARETYTVYFWKTLLNMLSCCLYNHYIYFTTRYTKNELKKNESYALLKNTIRLWYHLCEKHNIELYIGISTTNTGGKVTRYNYHYIKTREYESYSDFHRHIRPPLVCFDKNNEVYRLGDRFWLPHQGYQTGYEELICGKSISIQLFADA